MLARWGHLVYRHRRLVLALSGLGLLASILVMALVPPALSSSGFVDEQAESAKVDHQLRQEFGRGQDSLVLIFDAPRPVTEPSVRAAVEAALAPLSGDPRVLQVLTAWTTGNPAFVSRDGRATYAVALVTGAGSDHWQELRDRVRPLAEAAGLKLTAAGGPVIGTAIIDGVGAGIARAETVSIPLTILIQLVVFGGLVAAGVPLLVGALAIVGAIALIFALSTVTDQSVFTINIITMLGLGLGVDYSLFMVARFREEIRRRPTEEAIALTLATVGKAILFSGVTVIFGLAATHFFPLPALHSMGESGMIVVALALGYGLTCLPAVLAGLGPRVDAIQIGRRRRPAAGGANGEGGFWHAVAQAVMRRPVAVLVPVLLALLLAGVPFLRLSLTPGGPEVLPVDNPARAASDRLRTDFRGNEAETVPVLVAARDGNILSAASLKELRDVVARMAALPDAARVESFVTAPVAAGVNWATYAGDPNALPPALRTLIGEQVRGGTALVEVVTNAASKARDDLVRALRGLRPAGLTVAVGGGAGASVDTVDGIKAGVVPALLFVVIGSYLILLLTFGSVFLPLKAIFMTVLSISASLGALVVVFQDGHLENLLGFQASGQIVSTTPILMFCILFGLSMDYEVLMLTRVQEEYARSGDNTLAVARGLERTAKVVTGAAAIMVVVFAGFMLADIVIIKSMGFGLALAVLIDATIVRGLLVPATMRLMGRWNWWAPAWLGRAVGRLGLGHGDAGGAPASPLGLVARR